MLLRPNHTLVPPVLFAVLCGCSATPGDSANLSSVSNPTPATNAGSASPEDAGTVSAPTDDDASSASAPAAPTPGDDDSGATDAALDASGTSTLDAGHDAGGGESHDAGSDAEVDAGAVNGCTAADFALHDESGANGKRTITFAQAKPATQYDPNCMRIAKGQSVTWKGDLTLYSLAPFGGDTPSPILATKAGNQVKFAFAAAGTYGFHSPEEPATMFGAIDVTP